MRSAHAERVSMMTARHGKNYVLGLVAVALCLMSVPVAHANALTNLLITINGPTVIQPPVIPPPVVQPVEPQPPVVRRSRGGGGSRPSIFSFIPAVDPPQPIIIPDVPVFTPLPPLPPQPLTQPCRLYTSDAADE